MGPNPHCLPCSACECSITTGGRCNSLRQMLIATRTPAWDSSLVEAPFHIRMRGHLFSIEEGIQRDDSLHWKGSSDSTRMSGRHTPQTSIVGVLVERAHSYEETCLLLHANSEPDRTTGCLTGPYGCLGEQVTVTIGVRIRQRNETTVSAGRGTPNPPG
jgi:hypothetical protein